MLHVLLNFEDVVPSPLMEAIEMPPQQSTASTFTLIPESFMRVPSVTALM